MPQRAANNDWTPLDALRFLVRLGEMDLATSSEGDLLNFRDDLLRFLEAPASKLLPVSFARLAVQQPPDMETLRQFQAHIVGLLQFANYAMNTDGPVGVARRHFAVTPSIDIRLAITNGRQPQVEVTSARPLKLLNFKAQLVIFETGRGLIRACADPECERIFVRVRKQRYCSRECTNRASMRTYLSKPDKQAEHRETSHNSYARKTRKRTGQKVNVARRPRSTRKD